MTPKCHPEIAGQGIEYAWGYAKIRFYHHFNDCVGANLEKNMQGLLSVKESLTKDRTDKFVRKAKDYKMTYAYLLEQTNKVKAEGETIIKVSSIAQDKIENFIKIFKQHRSALYLYYTFIANA